MFKIRRTEKRKAAELARLLAALELAASQRPSRSRRVARLSLGAIR